MLECKLTKTAMTKLIGSLRRIASAHIDGVYIHHDYIVPKNELYARTIVKSFIPMEMDTVMELEDGFLDDSSEFLKLKGLTNIHLIYSGELLTIEYNASGSSDTMIFVIAHWCDISTITDEFNKAVFEKFESYDDVVKTVCVDNMINMTPDELNRIRLSEVVELVDNGLSTRISRNNIPLTGPLRKTGPIPFSASYCMGIVESIGRGSQQYRLTIYVNYRDFEAIHLYSFIPY